MKITTTKRIDTEGFAIQVEKTDDGLFEFYLTRKDTGDSMYLYMSQDEYDKFKLLILPLF